MTEELTAAHLRELGNLIAGVSAEERERMYAKAADYVRRHSAYVVPVDVEKVVDMFREVYPNRPVPELTRSGGGGLSKQPASPYVSYVVPAMAIASAAAVALLVFLAYSIAKRRSRPAGEPGRAQEPEPKAESHVPKQVSGQKLHVPNQNRDMWRGPHSLISAYVGEIRTAIADAEQFIGITNMVDRELEHMQVDGSERSSGIVCEYLRLSKEYHGVGIVPYYIVGKFGMICYHASMINRGLNALGNIRPPAGWHPIEDARIVAEYEMMSARSQEAINKVRDCLTKILLIKDKILLSPKFAKCKEIESDKRHIKMCEEAYETLKKEHDYNTAVLNRILELQRTALPSK